MKALIDQLRVRPRLLIAIAVGLTAGALLPGSLQGVTRLLIAWNLAVWFYLLLIARLMQHPDHGHLRRIATAQSEGAGAVLVIAIAAAVASMAAIFAELSGVKASGAGLAWPHLLLALATITGSWLLLPFEFALTYASRYFISGPLGSGLDFPGIDESAGGAALPNYADFVYFSLTIAATAQTSDIAVTTRAMRKLVVAHAVLSFGFNTAVLALAINIAASLL